MSTDIIAVAQRKGGACKSTTIRCLASRMSLDGANVLVLDTDAQKACIKYFEHENYNVYYDYIEDPKKIKKAIDQAKEQGMDLVLIDVAGLALASHQYAIANSDLVIVPCIPSDDDIEMALETLEDIDKMSETIGREIDARILISNAIEQANMTTTTIQAFKESDYPVLDTIMLRAEGVRQMRRTGLLPSTGPGKRSIESLMYEFQSKELLSFYKNKFGRAINA